MSRTNTL